MQKLNKTYSFYSNIEIYKSTNRFEHDLLSVDEIRKERILSYKNKDDQIRSLAVYLLFLKACKKLKLDISNYRIDEKGKPICDDFYFSFSHSENAVMVSISNNTVGCDVEMIKNHNPLLDQKISNTPLNNIDFYKIWVKKESYVKALGVGISKEFNNITIINNKINEYTVKILKKKNRYIYAVCSINPKIARIKYIKL